MSQHFVGQIEHFQLQMNASSANIYKPLEVWREKTPRQLTYNNSMAPLERALWRSNEIQQRLGPLNQ